MSSLPDRFRALFGSSVEGVDDHGPVAAGPCADAPDSDHSAPGAPEGDCTGSSSVAFMRDGVSGPRGAGERAGVAPVPPVRVPELVGLAANDAHDRALDAGLLAVPDNAVHTGAGRGPVEGQEPAAGTPTDRGQVVRIRIRTEGSEPPG